MAKPLTVHQYTPQSDSQVGARGSSMKGYRFVNNFQNTVVKSKLRMKPAFRVDLQRINPENQKSVIIEQRFAQSGTGKSLTNNISYTFEVNAKRRPGRPRKEPSSADIPRIKRPPGRPRKPSIEAESEINLGIVNPDETNVLSVTIHEEVERVRRQSAQGVIHSHEDPRTQLALAVAAATAAASTQVKVEAGHNNNDDDHDDDDDDEDDEDDVDEDEDEDEDDVEDEDDNDDNNNDNDDNDEISGD